MSGHSKWAQIKRQKGVADNRRGAVFTKLGNAITVATRSGGGDPDANFRLRLAIDKAKAANLPKDNIDRAIKRGTGELGGGVIEEMTYEGFGPDGIAVIIQAMTDNRNRTASSVKHILSKFGGSLGGPNTVSWMFEHRGVLRVPAVNDELELILIDSGITDLRPDESGATILTTPHDLEKIKKILEGKGVNVEYAEVEPMAKETKSITPATQEKLEKLFSALDEDMDVTDYYSNAVDN